MNNNENTLFTDNMADTFFIGQLNDPLQVAAATIAMPCFMFLTAFANLFGMGGSSLISRCLGSGDKEKARHTAAFCIWTGIIVSLLYGIAKKIDLLAYAIAQGMTQGTLPLIGYNYSSGNMKRMKESVKVAFLSSLLVADWIAFVISLALLIPCLMKIERRGDF